MSYNIINPRGGGHSLLLPSLSLRGKTCFSFGGGGRPQLLAPLRFPPQRFTYVSYAQLLLWTEDT